MPEFNSRCPQCGCPAYIGLSDVECSAPSCRLFKGPLLLCDDQGRHPLMILHDKAILSTATLLEKFGMDYDAEIKALLEDDDNRPIEQWD